MESTEQIEELKKKIRELESEKKKLADSQIKLGEVTNNYMMLHYLNKNINECDSSKKLWETYLHNITDTGFNYDNAYVILKNSLNEEEDNFTTAVYLENGKSVVKKINSSKEKFISEAMQKLNAVTSEENTKIAIPIINSLKEIKAVLVVENPEGITFEDIELLEIYAQQTVAQIDNIILNENLMFNQSLLGEKINQFVMLHYVSKDIHDSKGYYEVLEKYLRALTSEMGFNFKESYIYIIEGNNIKSVQRVSIKNEKLFFKDELEELKDELLESIELKDSILCDDGKKVVMPLKSFDNISAVIEIINDTEISQESIQLLEIFALQTAAMLDNTKLNFHLEKEVENRTKELKEAYEELKKMDILKDKFLSMISHELRTPITSIMAYLETLISSIEDGSIEEELEKEFIEIAFKESGRLKKIVDDVIDLSKLEAGTMELSMEKRNISDIARKVCENFKDDFENKKIKLLYNIEKESCFAKIDRIRIIQVLNSIISNAIKFSKENGKIEIKILNRDEKVVLSVKDYGIGIKNEDFERVFSRFEQVEKIEHHNAGTGLGMPIAKKIVEQMGGEMWIESSFGEWSEFCIAFRCCGEE